MILQRSGNRGQSFEARDPRSYVSVGNKKSSGGMHDRGRASQLSSTTSPIMSIPSFPKPDLAIPKPPKEGDGLIRHPRLSDSFMYEPTSRRVRGVLGADAIVDSRHQVLVWEPSSPVPEYAFPVKHVRMDLLAPSKHPEAGKKYYRPKSNVDWYDLVIGDRTIPAAAWKWRTPGLEGYVSFAWSPDVLDRWYEEEEVVFGHPRSPFARIDVIPSTRHVKVLSKDDVVLAESSKGLALFESGLPTRFYLPPNDVKWDALQGVEMSSVCPYKGHCDRYWRTKTRDDAIAWSYREPLHQVSAIKGHVAFYNEKVKLQVDGVPFVDSPATWA